MVRGVAVVRGIFFEQSMYSPGVEGDIYRAKRDTAVTEPILTPHNVWRCTTGKTNDPRWYRERYPRCENGVQAVGQVSQSLCC